MDVIELFKQAAVAMQSDMRYLALDAARRASGTVVTLACTHPEETCFCQSFGIDPATPQGDISCWIEGETLFWQTNTEKGEALTAKLWTRRCSGI